MKLYDTICAWLLIVAFVLATAAIIRNITMPVEYVGAALRAMMGR